MALSQLLVDRSLNEDCVQVAGFVQHYEGLSYATVKGAGHMVGQAKPAEALSLIDSFLRKESF